jgi:hypothetical protein
LTQAVEIVETISDEERRHHDDCPKGYYNYLMNLTVELQDDDEATHDIRHHGDSKHADIDELPGAGGVDAVCQLQQPADLNSPADNFAFLKSVKLKN